jgi:hypothetical protein
VHHGSIVEKDSRSDDENVCGTGKRRIRKHGKEIVNAPFVPPRDRGGG